MTDFNANVVEEFRANRGVVGGPFAGRTMLLLHTTGARSGEPRLSPLVYVTVDGRMLIIASYAGAPSDPAWAHNLRAQPRARIEAATPDGIVEREVLARELPPDERDTVYPAVIAQAPNFADYQSKTSRVIPIFELG
ncbi:MAG: nitroreductase family deazaflavin-dependent oxidoreductase [Mycobacterium sp.]